MAIPVVWGVISSKRLSHNGYNDFGKKPFHIHHIHKVSLLFEFHDVLRGITSDKSLSHIYNIHKSPPCEFSDVV